MKIQVYSFFEGFLGFHHRALCRKEQRRNCQNPTGPLRAFSYKFIGNATFQQDKQLFNRKKHLFLIG